MEIVFIKSFAHLKLLTLFLDHKFNGSVFFFGKRKTCIDKINSNKRCELTMTKQVLKVDLLTGLNS